MHLDTSVLIPMLKKKGRKDDIAKAAIRLRERAKRRGHTKLKITLPVLGELVLFCLREQTTEPLEELMTLKNALGEKLELGAVPKFRNTALDFHEVLSRLLRADDYLRDSPADAIIIALAVMDPEADVLKINDTTIILSGKLREEVNALRDELGFKKLKIKPLAADDSRRACYLPRGT